MTEPFLESNGTHDAKVLAGWRWLVFIIRSLNPLLRMVSISLLVVGWSVSKFEWSGFYLIPGDVAWLVDSRAVGHLVGMTGVVVFMCAFALLAPIIQKDFERRKKSRWSICWVSKYSLRLSQWAPFLSALLVGFILSLAWELLIQPFIMVYLGPARGWVQWAQVLCDGVGITIGSALAKTLMLRFRKFN